MKNLEHELAQLQEEMAQFSQSIRVRGWNSDVKARYSLLNESIMDLERKIAAERGEEFVLQIDLLSPPAAAAGKILVITNDFSCYICCGEPGGYCFFFLVQAGVRAECINDEVLSGHSLFGKGLDVQSSYLVQNSNWIKTLKAVHSVHSQYSEKRFDSLNHFLFFYRNRIVEVLSHEFPTVHEFESYDEAVSFSRFCL